MGITEIKLKVDSENSEAFELHSVLQYCKKLSASPQDDEAHKVNSEILNSWTSAVQASELLMRNLSLEMWAKESPLREEDVLSWKPGPEFSIYLSSQIDLAFAALRKAEALKIRLASETEIAESKKPWLANRQLKENRLSVVAELMTAEDAALKRGTEVLKKMRRAEDEDEVSS